MNNSADTTTWTNKQRSAFEALKASVATNEARRLNRASIMNKAPKSGWTNEDRIK